MSSSKRSLNEIDLRFKIEIREYERWELYVYTI
jgi:hypothetical protein